MKPNDGGPAFPCKWCSEPAFRKSGHIWLCVKHSRFSTMRTRAKTDGKTVPSYDELESLVPPDMICPSCGRRMNWLAKDGHSTVITLQHDRCGTHRLICLACNTRHGQMNGDEFYSMPQDKKHCPRCKRLLPFSSFNADNSKRWKSRKTYCKECASAYHTEWTRKNRDAYNRKQREYRAKRKASGNPVR